MPGPMPKPRATRQRMNKTTTGATLEAAPAMRQGLPDHEPGWASITLAWWSTIWASPMAGEWVDADVPGLVALARLVDAFWAADISAAPKIHAEIRMASREFGLSPFSRRQLQWEIKWVEAATRTPPVTIETAAVRRSRMKALA